MRPSIRFLSSLRHQAPVNLQHIVQHSHQLPLTIHLLSPSETESPETYPILYMCEHRFHDTQSTAIDMSSGTAVDLSLHLLDQPLLPLFADPKPDVDLAGRSLLRVPQTAFA